MVQIVPSILAADYTRLGEQVREAEAAGVAMIQIDIMDGCFAPNLSFGPGIVAALRPLVDLAFDVHLMIVDPDRYLATFVKAGANRLIVHQEACTHLHSTLQSIRLLGIQAGVTLNPATPVHVLEDVLDLVDIVQVMTVNPGFGGQAFIHSQLAKIRRLRAMLDERDLAIPIGVDGGIDTTTAPLVVEAGATVLVAGSSVFNQQASVAENVAALLASVAAH